MGRPDAPAARVSVRAARRAGPVCTAVRLGVLLLAAGGARMPDADACVSDARAPFAAPQPPLRQSNKRAAEPPTDAVEALQKRPHVGDHPPAAVVGAADAGAGAGVVGAACDAGGGHARGRGAFNDKHGGSPFDERMHQRNRYFGRRPDFAALAAQFPDFAALTTADSRGRVHVDWQKF
jgi:hypothetical protein